MTYSNQSTDYNATCWDIVNKLTYKLLATYSLFVVKEIIRENKIKDKDIYLAIQSIENLLKNNSLENKKEVAYYAKHLGGKMENIYFPSVIACLAACSAIGSHDVAMKATYAVLTSVDKRIISWTPIKDKIINYGNKLLTEELHAI